ncbi:MAG: putative toxin-antitoxin system toxin component, PIN family [Anaerolineaceae bacterium]|nr:putative toxin-antitoxin system toxin component, PIN family [Anaerolineaceae bacterium]
MIIFIDTNIIFSAALWPNSKPAMVLEFASLHHHLMVCSQNVLESCEIILRKAPNRINALLRFYDKFQIDLVPSISFGNELLIRDETDQPILNAALFYGADIILTGDKDFLSLNLKYPKCMTAAEFMNSYMRD